MAKGESRDRKRAVGKDIQEETGIKSVAWNDVVIEILCWGWIDGVKKSIDD